MRFGKTVSPFALTFIFLFYSIMPAASYPGNESGTSRILWAFGAIRTSSSTSSVEPVTTKMILSSGDKLKMMIQLRNKCFVYLLHRDSQGNYAMLFPYSLKQFDTDYRIASNYYAPKGDAWFQLDGRTGTETFYLIASDQRLLDIEYIYGKYASSDGAGKQDLAIHIGSELDKIAERHLASSGEAENLPGAGGSALRGFERATGRDPTDISGLAREISFEGIYSEIFVIDHR